MHDASIVGANACCLIALARLLEVCKNVGAQRNLVLWGPAAEPLACFEAALAVGPELLKIRCRPWAALDIGQYGLVDRKRQIGADEIGIFQRTQHRKPSSERSLDHSVDRLCVTDAALDQRDRL